MWLILGVSSIIFTTFSILLNLTLFWFNRKIIIDKENVENDLFVLKDILEDYIYELERVSGMEMYNGDVTIGNLLRKTVAIKDNIEEFHEIYYSVPREIENEKEISKKA